jgi:superfamily II DNA or RNA helicase
MEYLEFLSKKAVIDPSTGLVEVPPLNPMLFPFQSNITRWALRRGRAAIFAGCGMGKTPMQLEWAKHVPGRVLILAPLAVASQTVHEGEKFGVDVIYRREGGNDLGKITITNYEMMEHFDLSVFEGIVLDESSILKAFDGKTRNLIIESFAKTPYRLACTATPAPNDYMELGNHSEFLGIMSRVEMLSMFFVHDGGDTSKWRLKGHAQQEFWKWLASWAVCIQKPSDLGYDDGAFKLPPLTYHHHQVAVEKPTNGDLFIMPAATLQERIRARGDTVSERVKACADLVNGSDESWLIWCNLNSESDALKKAINGAVEVKGADSVEHKEDALFDFSEGKIKILVSKPSIAGYGMNFQVCHNMAFVGLTDSWEQYYQAVRRCWRFGQDKPVNVHIITAETEGFVVDNIKRKEKDADIMANEMLEHMADLNAEAIKGASARVKDNYTREEQSGENWKVYLADCVEVAKELPANSLHYSVFSPPFSSLYTYSNSDRDMGNCSNDDTFMEHFGFLIGELYRAIMPGRLVSFHCTNIASQKVRDGVIGVKDFRGDLIRAFQKHGFIYHSEVCIWKDPVTAMQRTKALGLLHTQIKKDSCMSRQGFPDYLVTMRKPGENPEPVTHTNESFPVQVWQRYASPVWMDINPSDTLQFRSAREHNDERHICPLQLQVIERALELWSNPGDTVFSPFTGIGSEGFVALQMGRKFIGAELKRSYYEQACRNLASAHTQSGDLFAQAVA